MVYVMFLLQPVKKKCCLIQLIKKACLTKGEQQKSVHTCFSRPYRLRYLGVEYLVTPTDMWHDQGFKYC